MSYTIQTFLLFYNSFFKFFFIGLILAGFYTNSFAQIKKNVSDDYNFFYQKEKLDQQYSVITNDSQDNEATHYQRWVQFWKGRIDNQNGNMGLYSQRMFENFNSFKSLRGSNNSGTCSDGCGNCCFPSNWTSFGPSYLANNIQNLGKIVSIWVDPTDENNILAGAESGLWKTIDGGQNWKCITDYCLPSIGVKWIAVQPDNFDIIYISTGTSFGSHEYGYGIYKTSDGGQSWTQCISPGSSPENMASAKVLIHPVYYNVLYAAVGYRVYKSINFGATWTEVFGILGNPEKQMIYDMEIVTNGTNDEVYVTSYSNHNSWNCLSTPLPGTYNWGTIGVYCEVRNSAKAWLFISPNNSLSFSNAQDLNTIFSTSPLTFDDYNSMGAVCYSANNIYVAFQHGVHGFSGTPQVAIYSKPALGSGAWTKHDANVNNLNYGFSFAFEVSPVNPSIVYVGGNVLDKSNNAGLTYSPQWAYWAFATNPNAPHADTRCLIYYKNAPSGDVLFFGTDGGIGKSIDGGATTLNLNGYGMQTVEFWGISNSEITPNLLYGGAQDNGIFNNSSQFYKNDPYGDAYDAVVDVTNPLIAYTTKNSTGIYKTINGGTTWNYAFPCPLGEGCTNLSLYIDNSNNLYAGGNNLWKISGSTWQQITFINNSRISDIELSQNANIAYVSYDGPTWGIAPVNKVLKISNLNTTPLVSDISAGIDGCLWANATDVATDDNGNDVWVCFDGMWDVNKKVYYRHNNIWSEFGLGLPNIPVNTIEYYKGSNKLLFVGTDDGVYYRDGNMSQWEKFSCGLPHVIITDLEINYATNELRAATFARSVWKTTISKIYTDVSCSSSPIINASINSNTPVSLVNNQILYLSGQSASIKIELSNLCSITTCCNNGNSINWKVLRNGLPYSSGSGSIINFSGILKNGFLFWLRYTYTVEINIKCGNNNCDPLRFSFKGF